MNRKQIYFLSPNTGATGSPADRKAVAAARSEARSHAAKVSYPPGFRVRRISINSKADAGTLHPGEPRPGPESSQSDTCSDDSCAESARATDSVASENSKGNKIKQTSPAVDWKFKQYVKKDRSKKKAPRKSPSSPPSIPEIITKSALDPFFRPAVELSVPDQHLLHAYLSTMPDGLFGASSGSASEIIRSRCLGVIANNAIVLMWMLLAVESHHVSFQANSNDRLLSILARRADAYKLMKESLDSQVGRSLDFAFTVSMAAGVEFRLGNSPAAQQHVKAVRKILSLRGGSKAVRDIPDPFGLMLVSILVDQGDPSLFECSEALRGKVKSIVQRLHQYQSWNYSLRSESSPPSPMSVLSILMSSSDEDEFGSPVLASFEGRVRAFGKDCPLGKYIALPPNGPDEGGYRFLLSVLYAMNTAFWDFRHSPRASNEYLSELKRSVELTKTSNLVLQAGLSKLPSLLMLMMHAHQSATNEGRASPTSVVFHNEEVFEFVNLVMMGGTKIRTRVLEALLSWLTTTASNMEDLILLDEADFETLEQEVEESWVADQARRLVNMKLA